MVADLEPNTRYEFVVRLHLDQISSPWSPVVYHQTLPAGEEPVRFGLTVTEIVTKSIVMRTNISCLLKGVPCTYSTTETADWSARDADRERHRPGVLERT